MKKRGLAKFTCAVHKRFADDTLKVQKEILGTIGSNLTLSSKILSIEARKLFYLVEQCLANPATINEALEPVNNGLVEVQNKPAALPYFHLLDSSIEYQTR